MYPVGLSNPNQMRAQEFIDGKKPNYFLISRSHAFDTADKRASLTGGENRSVASKEGDRLIREVQQKNPPASGILRTEDLLAGNLRYLPQSRRGKRKGVKHVARSLVSYKAGGEDVEPRFNEMLPKRPLVRSQRDKHGR